MQHVTWPTRGDSSTFRRRATLLTAIGAVPIAGALGVAWVLQPQLVPSLTPLASAAALLLALWVHGAARVAARRAEVERSFGGMLVRHHGSLFAVASSPVLAEHATRRNAARAALDRGGWAIIVRAWDRFYVLACEPASDTSAAPAPVSFRTRAVADVVPAIRDIAVA